MTQLYGYWGLTTSETSLYEFKVPLALDPTKTLKGFTLRDNDPDRNWTYRGLVVMAATAFATGTVGDVDATTSIVSVSPDLIPNDAATQSTITVNVFDDDYDAVGGLGEGAFSVVVTGTGNNPVTWVGEGATGVYTWTMTGDTPGDKTVSVTADSVGLSMQPTITVYDANKPTQGTLDALPTDIPDDGAYPSVLTIELANAGGTPASGYTSDITVVQTAGSGTTSIGTVSEPDPTGNPGVYEVEVTGTGLGDAEVTVYVYQGTGDEVVLGPAALTVFTPGAGDYPLADASNTATAVTDTDRTSNELITLDGSVSHDDTGITNYAWSYATGDHIVLYSGVDSVVMDVPLSIGVHELVLTVTDADSHTHSDAITITISPPDDTSVQLDISGQGPEAADDGFTLDAILGWKESRELGAYDADYDPGRNIAELQGRLANGVFLQGGYVPMGNGNLLVGATRNVVWWNYGSTTVVLGDQGLPDHGILCGADRIYHVASIEGNATLAGDWTEVADPQHPTATEDPEDPGTWIPDGLMENRPNVLAIHTEHSSGTFQLAEAVAVLPAAQQVPYDDINFLLATSNGDRARNVEIRAIYTDDSEALLYAFSTEEGGSGPAMYGDPADDPLGHFVPVYTSTRVYNVSTYYWGNIGAGPTERILWEFETPLALNPAKALKAIKVVDSNPSLNWNARGLTVFAASAHEASGAPLEVTAALAAGEDWVYQNTETTTADRHTSLATISLVSEASPGEVYDVSIADDGPGTNFTLGAVVDNRPGEQTLTVPIIGGRVGASTPGGGGAAYNVTLTVEGQTSTQSDTADVSLTLRYIGDVDGSGAPGAQDKQFFNQRLNNVATAYPDRCYDLNGSGGAPNAEDKQVMNQVLNGVSLP